MTLDLYGHLFENRLDESAECLDAAARASGDVNVTSFASVVDLAQRRQVKH